MPLLPKERGERAGGRKPQYGYRPPQAQADYIERLKGEAGWDNTRALIYLVDIARQLDETLGAADSKKVAELADANRLTIGQQLGALVKQALQQKK